MAVPRYFCRSEEVDRFALRKLTNHIGLFSDGVSEHFGLRKKV